MKRLASSRAPLPTRLYYGWVIVAVTAIMNLAASPTNPVIFSFFIAPMIEELGWSRSSLSWGLTLRLVVAGVMAPLLGMLIDRHGSRWLGAFAGLVAGLCLIGLSFTYHLWFLYLMFAVSGLGGFGGPGGALLTTVPVAKWFIAQRGRAMAIATLGMPLGTVLFIPIAQLLIQTVGWRQAWVVFGAMVCVLAVPLCAAFMRREPEDLGLHPDGATVRDTAAPQTKNTSSEATDVDWTPGQALRSPTLWLVLGALAVMGLALNGTLVHRVAFWQERGMSPALVALGTALDPLAVVFSGLAFGLLGERVRSRYLGLMGGAGLALSMLPMVFATSHAYSIIASNLMWGLAVGLYITVNNLIWPNYFGKKHLGAIRGIVFLVSIGATGVGAPLYGYLFDAALSPSFIWTVSLTAFLLGGLLLLLAKPPRLRLEPAKRY